MKRIITFFVCILTAFGLQAAQAPKSKFSSAYLSAKDDQNNKFAQSTNNAADSSIDSKTAHESNQPTSQSCASHLRAASNNGQEPQWTKDHDTILEHLALCVQNDEAIADAKWCVQLGVIRTDWKAKNPATGETLAELAQKCDALAKGEISKKYSTQWREIMRILNSDNSDTVNLRNKMLLEDNAQSKNATATDSKPFVSFFEEDTISKYGWLKLHTTMFSNLMILHSQFRKDVTASDEAGYVERLAQLSTFARSPLVQQHFKFNFKQKSPGFKETLAQHAAQTDASLANRLSTEYQKWNTIVANLDDTK